MTGSSARYGLFAVGGAALLCACTSILGGRDLSFDATSATVDGGDAAALDGSTVGQDASPTCVANVQTDPANCGRCGHDCLGAGCNAGVCQSKPIVTALDGPYSLGIDDTSIYVAMFRGGQIVRMNKDGSNKRVLASGLDKPWGVGAQGGFVYWAEDDAQSARGGVWRCALTAEGCGAPTRITPSEYPSRLVVNGQGIFFAGESTHGLKFANLDGSGVKSLATNGSTFGIAVNQTHAYYTSGAAFFYRVPVGGGTPEAMGPSGATRWGLAAVDSKRAYWTNYDRDTNLGSVLSVPLDSPSGQIVTYNKDANVAPLGVAADDKYVYWSNNGTTAANNFSARDGSIVACPVAGCVGAPLQMADGLAYPGEIVQDATAIYVVIVGDLSKVDGAVLRIAKP